MKRGFAFQFDPPRGWSDFQDGNRFVFQGPRDEELIVSGSVISGHGAAPSYQQIREQLVANAMAAMRRAVNHPDLIVKNDMKESLTVQNLRSWTMDAETADHSVIFLQAAVEAEGGVLLVTLEAPRDDSARRIFKEFINGVRPTLAEQSRPS